MDLLVRYSRILWTIVSMGGECRMAGVAVATPTLPVPHPTFYPFIIIGHTNFDLLVNHIMFWPHELWKPSSAHDCEVLCGLRMYQQIKQ